MQPFCRPVRTRSSLRLCGTAGAETSVPYMSPRSETLGAQEPPPLLTMLRLLVPQRV